MHGCWQFTSSCRKQEKMINIILKQGLTIVRIDIKKQPLRSIRGQSKCKLTSRKGNSSASSICITCPIFGLFWAFGSTQRKATNRARFSALEEGFSGNLGSKTPSAFRFVTMVLSHSTRFTWKIDLPVYIRL